MAEMIAERRNSGEVGRHDLLSSLLEANTSNSDIEGLTDTELMGMSFKASSLLSERMVIQPISTSSSSLDMR